MLFDPPTTGKIAVKVVNHYGDEVLKVFRATVVRGYSATFAPRPRPRTAELAGASAGLSPGPVVGVDATLGHTRGPGLGGQVASGGGRAADAGVRRWGVGGGNRRHLRLGQDAFLDTAREAARTRSVRPHESVQANADTEAIAVITVFPSAWLGCDSLRDSAGPTFRRTSRRAGRGRRML